MRPSVPELVGVVAVVKDSGLRLEGSEGWCNFSKWAPVPRPERGQRVRLQVDDKGWIKALELAEAPVDDQAARSVAPTSARDHGDTRDPTLASELQTRLACLQAAAVFLAGRDHVDTRDLTLAAEVLARWALGPPSEHP